ncbi:hypothetical protein Syun_020512 [Stephania yunnanensis]|uniref:Uncharacterized protein n=1 Tax=Stephania yunnanensis TaxID=152371 RepID=A0AAP0IEM2_9MAGN
MTFNTHTHPPPLKFTPHELSPPPLARLLPLSLSLSSATSPTFAFLFETRRSSVVTSMIE